METVFFYISKIAWRLVRPDSLLVILCCLLWLSLAFKRYRLATWLGSIVTLCVLIIAFFPLGAWLAAPIEKTFPNQVTLPARVDGIIVLGGSIDAYRSHSWQSVELGPSAEREFAFLSLAKRFPEAKLVFTGGTGSVLHQEYKEATYAKQLYQQQGLSLSRVIFEDQSRNTYENAVNSHALVKPKPGEYWVLVTSALHMKRSMGVFCQVGWPVKPYPVDHLAHKNPISKFFVLDFAANLYKFRWVLREYLGLWVYQLTGKTAPISDSCWLQD